MTAGALFQALDAETIRPLSSERLNKVAKEQTLEILDNLGYIDLDLNDNLDVDDVQVAAALNQLRQDMQNHHLPGSPPKAQTGLLTPRESDFCTTLTSLDGRFKLADFPLEHIKANPLLTRVLNYRLAILALTYRHMQNQFAGASENALGQLGQLAGVSTGAETLALTDDFDRLIEQLINLKGVADSDFCGIVYFQNKADTRVERRFNNKVGHFVANMNELSGARLDDQRQVIRNSGRLSSRQWQQVSGWSKQFNNLFYIRVLQIALVLAGTYDARLDSKIGDISLNAIANYVEMENHDEDDLKLDSRDFVVRLAADVWAINVVSLLGSMLADKQSSPEEPLGSHIEALAAGLSAEDKPILYEKVDQLVEQSKRQTVRRAKSSVGFFQRIGRFFKKVGQAIVRGIEAVIGAVTRLFQWLTNGVRLLLEEVRQAIDTARRASQFVFGNKDIVTGNIRSSFDIDFDVTTTIGGSIDDALVAQHNQQLQATTQALVKTTEVLTVALPLVINLLKGPLGWTKAALALVKSLLRHEVRQWLPI